MIILNGIKRKLHCQKPHCKVYFQYMLVTEGHFELNLKHVMIHMPGFTLLFKVSIVTISPSMPENVEKNVISKKGQKISRGT